MTDRQQPLTPDEGTTLFPPLPPVSPEAYRERLEDWPARQEAADTSGLTVDRLAAALNGEELVPLGHDLRPLAARVLARLSQEPTPRCDFDCDACRATPDGEPTPDERPLDVACTCEPEHVWPCATIQRCDEPGCEREATCGWPTRPGGTGPNGGYRRTCDEHMRAARRSAAGE